MNLKEELRQGSRSVVSAAIAAGVTAFARWVKTRPLKRAIQRRRERRKAEAAK